MSAPLLSPEASSAWDRLVARARLCQGPSYSPPPKPSEGLFTPEGQFRATSTQNEQPHFVENAIHESWLRGSGAGIQITIYDSGFFFDHPALPATLDRNLIAGQNLPENFAHGTRTLGVLAMQHSGPYGKGIVPDAKFRFAAKYDAAGQHPTFNSVLSKLILCADATPRRNILHLGFAYGPNSLPLESDPFFHDALSLACAAEVLVIQPAGNQNQSLDPCLLGRPDAGTFLVAAGDAKGNRTAATNYGSRVHFFCHGDGIHTLDGGTSGSLQFRNFQMTSAASAILSGIIAAVQAALQAQQRELLSPCEMMASLQIGAFPCRVGAQIGVRPSLEAIFNFLAL
jgi:hypothetical protein